MKKAIATLVVFGLILSISSCSGDKYKKVVPGDEPPAAGDTAENPSEDKNAGDDTNTPANKNTDSTVQEQQPEQVEEQQPPQDNQPVIIGDLPSGLSNEAISSWMPAVRKDHTPPALNSKYKNLLDKYNGYFSGTPGSNTIYLTFDEGYEYKFTPRILDILKANDVKATFFLVKSYIKNNPELVKRMVDEGHTVGNHTVSHPNMPNLLSQKGVDAVAKELTDTADYFKEITGKDMPKFYRPPEGVWSEATLYIADSLGYKTILWGIAHRDWDVNNQPGKEAALKVVNDRYYDGAIILLHPQSQSNTEALDEIIKSLKSKGYNLAPLSEIK